MHIMLELHGISVIACWSQIGFINVFNTNYATVYFLLSRDDKQTTDQPTNQPRNRVVAKCPEWTQVCLGISAE